jgi:hypothetical protein
MLAATLPNQLNQTDGIEAGDKPLILVRVRSKAEGVSFSLLSVAPGSAIKAGQVQEFDYEPDDSTRVDSGLNPSDLFDRAGRQGESSRRGRGAQHP